MNEFTEAWYRNELNLAKQMIKPIRGEFCGSVLDYGTCHGAYLEVLNAMGCSAIGVDIDSSYIRWCQDRGLNAVVVAPGNNLPFPDGSFDVVLASHVLEHLFEPFGFLREAWRLLKVDGTLVLVLPNADNLRAASFSAGHINYYDPGNIYFTARAAGFHPARIASDWPLASRIAKSIGLILPLTPGNWASLRQRRVLRLLPHFHVGINLYCVARKASDTGPNASIHALEANSVDPRFRETFRDVPWLHYCSGSSMTTAGAGQCSPNPDLRSPVK